MPYKNRSTPSYKEGLYHSYARGVNRCLIFRSDTDKKFFVYFIKKYLTKNFKLIKKVNQVPEEFPVNSAYMFVELQAFCLMDNHFHFLLLCKEDKGIAKFMTRILSNYTVYFNKKYKRQGPLFQGSYRSVHIKSESQLNIVGVYIHTNADKKGIVLDKQFDSKHNYVNNIGYKWLHLNKSLQKNIDFRHLDKYYELLDLSDRENTELGIL